MRKFAIAIICLLLFQPTFAFWKGSKPDFLTSQRNVVNLNFISSFDYQFINHFLSGDASVGPFGGNYSATTKTWMQIIDAQGWPNDASASGNTFGGSLRVPSSSNFSGTYVATWDGDGTTFLSSSGTCTETNSQTTYTRTGNCRWATVTGQTAHVEFTLSGLSTPTLISVQFLATGGSDGFLRNFKFYRKSDETDLLAGKVFRSAYKQQIINLLPSAVRCMNWHGGNNAQNNRWEYRTLPNAAGYSSDANWVASPPYGVTTGTNQWSLAAVTTGANQTPASMLHGEVATMRFGSGMVRAGNPTVTAVQAQNNPTVTAVAHGFLAGDTVIIYTGSVPSGMMTKLNYFPVTISSVTDADHFVIAANTSTFGAFTGTANATQFATMNIGSRGAYPIIFPLPTPAASFSNAYIAAGDYKTMVFDKTVASQTDGAGNWVYGVWIFNDIGNDNGHSGDVPVEICTALVNELNQQARAQSINTPINLWINMPHRALLPMDPDYSTGSDFALNAMSAIMNGANGYAGLDSKASVIVEYSNETWNFASGGFAQTFFLWYRGYQRWPASGTSDGVDMAALRSTSMARDIRTVYAGNPRVKITLGGWGSQDIAVNGFNYGRVNGNATPGNPGYYYSTDALVTAGSWGAPKLNHDAFNTASYFDPPNSYYSTLSGTGTFTDDSAMYNGTNNTANSGGNYTGAANPTQAITNFVNRTICGSATCSGQTGTGQSTNLYLTLSANYAAGVSPMRAIEYEGGTDWPVAVGASSFAGALTAAQSAFSTGVINSSQWQTAQVGYFNSRAVIANTGPPAIYLETNNDGQGGADQRWAYATPDSNTSSTEGQALLNSLVWSGMSARNAGLSP